MYQVEVLHADGALHWTWPTTNTQLSRQAVLCELTWRFMSASLLPKALMTSPSKVLMRCLWQSALCCSLPDTAEHCASSVESSLRTSFRMVPVACRARGDPLHMSCRAMLLHQLAKKAYGEAAMSSPMHRTGEPTQEAAAGILLPAQDHLLTVESTA